MDYLFMLFPTIIGGLIQATTGFGSGVFMMLFLPMILPMLQATAISTFILVWLNLFLAVQYRQYFRPRLVLPPVGAYCICSFLAIRFAKQADVRMLKSYFGLFLIVLAIYFLFFNKRIKVSGGAGSALVCGGLSGIVSGLFGIGGPPMAIYFLAVCGNDKNKYIASTQAFFAAACVFSSVVRACSGILTLELLPLAIPGIVGVWIGKQIGVRILDRLPIETIRKLVYIFLGLSGIITFLSSR